MLHLFPTDKTFVCGCDEAGRGCLAGPVVAAAVILPRDFSNDLLNDSKKLSHTQREQLRVVIEKEAVSYAVGFVSSEEIDLINILKASFKAMHKAMDQLPQIPELILVDGNRFTKYKDIPHHTIIKGDGKFLEIAAASVLAKTYRDDWMGKMHEQYPEYNWKKNKGYPTIFHREVIAEYGITTLHRKSFRLLPETMQLPIFNNDGNS